MTQRLLRGNVQFYFSFIFLALGHSDNMSGIAGEGAAPVMDKLAAASESS